MIPSWFLPVALMVPAPAVPLRLETPQTARRAELVIRPNVDRQPRDRRFRIMVEGDRRAVMEVWAQEFKHRSAAPASVCTASGCTIPVMSQLGGVLRSN